MFFWAHALIICHQCVVGLAGPISSDVMWMKLSFGYIFPLGIQTLCTVIFFIF